MRKTLANWVMACCTVCVSVAVLAQSTPNNALHNAAQGAPPEVRSALPTATLSGQGKMSFLGFSVYQASLWVAPDFVESAYAQSAFALELAYLRDFKGADIARRSVQEMRRQGSLPAEQEARWEAQMRVLFPDVKSGDRITGVHQPGQGASFWANGRLLGEVRDPEFAKLFFGIWLAPQTSEPGLRQTLLARSRVSPANAPNAPNAATP